MCDGCLPLVFEILLAMAGGGGRPEGGETHGHGVMM